MTPEQRAAARARCEAATPGPWEWGAVEPACLVADCQRRVILRECPPGFAGRDVRAFISHARTDLPRALDEIDRLEALLRAAGVDPAAGGQLP